MLKVTLGLDRKYELTNITIASSLQWIIKLNVRANTVKIEKTAVNIHSLGLGNGYLGMTQNVRATKENIN